MKDIKEFLLEKQEDVCPKCGKKECECENDDETCPKCGKKKSECTCEKDAE